MRIGLFGVVAVCGLALGTAAMAQSSATASSTTTDDIVCKMSDTCADASAAKAPGRQLGDEKKFSFQMANDAAASSSAGGGRATGDEKKFSLQLANTHAAAPTPAAAPSKKQPAYYAASANHKAPHAAAPATEDHSMTMQIQFQVGSAELSDGATTELVKYAAALKDPKLADMKFVVGGHTDSTGRRAKNVDLSQRRAQTVVDYLTSNGIAADRLVAKGYGPDRPLAGTSARNPANRRVEFARID